MIFGNIFHELLLHQNFPGKGLVVQLIHEDLVGFGDMQVLGDVRIPQHSERVKATAEARTSARSKRKPWLS